MFLRRFFNLESGAIFFSILHFYLSNYIASFRLMGLGEYAAISQHFAYIALVIAVLLSFMSIWSHRGELFRHGNSLKILILVAVTIFLLMATKDIGMVLFLPVGLVLIKTKDRDVFQYIFYASVLFYVLTVLMYMAGFINGGDKIDTPLFDSKENIQQLYSLGFNNPNVAYRFFMPILLSGLYLFGHRKRAILIFMTISIVLGMITGCTAGVIVALVACVGFILIKGRSFKRFVQRIAPYMFIILTLFSFLVAVSYGPVGTLPNPVNDSLTGRPRLWNLRIENESYLNLIGHNDEYVSSRLDENGSEQHYYALDNSFLFLMVHYGLLIYLLYFLVYYKSMKVIKDERILLIGVVLILYLTVEKSDFISNIFLLFAIKYLAIYYFRKEKLNA